MKRQTGWTLSECAVVVVMVFGVVGWVWNIVKIAQSSFADITGLLVLRVVGIFVAPLGSVLGFL